MAAYLDRALILFEQSRLDLAEKEVVQELGQDPNSPLAHALLALCLSKRKEYDRATEEARAAVHLGPDMSFAHYALASVYHDRDWLSEAQEAIREAIRLNPGDVSCYALEAGIYFDQRDWQKALESAERGLHFDAENVGCNNLRAMALVKLGRKQEAGATIEAALAREPENAVTHANQGWTYLEKGDPKKALEHFREALRHDPELEWARGGMVEALKARHIVYNLMLRYFLWMGKLGRQAQVGVIVGLFVAYHLVRKVAESNPVLAPWLWPGLYAYVFFALMTWFSAPLFNMLLRFNRFGRYALSRDQVVCSNWLAACLLAGLLCLVITLATGDSVANTTAFVAALTFFVLLYMIQGTFSCTAGWPRILMGAYAILFGAMGFFACALGLLHYLIATDPRGPSIALGFAVLCINIEYYMIMAGIPLAIGLPMVRPRR
jgi:Tfp pilus assembly protein PilF